MPPSRPPPLRRLCQAAALAVLAGALPLVLAATDTARMEDIARARYGEAVAAAVDGNDFGAVQQAIEDGSGGGNIS